MVPSKEWPKKVPASTVTLPFMKNNSCKPVTAARDSRILKILPTLVPSATCNKNTWSVCSWVPSVTNMPCTSNSREMWSNAGNACHSLVTVTVNPALCRWVRSFHLFVLQSFKANILNHSVRLWNIVIFFRSDGKMFVCGKAREVRSCFMCLTHWGRETHICVSKQIIIGSDNGLSPGRRQAIIWTNAGILLIGPLGTNFSEILIEILTFSFKKMRLKVSSAKRRPFCFGLNELNTNAKLHKTQLKMDWRLKLSEHGDNRGPSTHLYGIRSLVPPLIGPPSHWSPSHWSPNSLVPQYIIGAHWSPISLVPHIIGPPSHWSPFSLVTPSSANPNGPPCHWSPISLVPHLISPPTHQSSISLVPN